MPSAEEGPKYDRRLACPPTGRDSFGLGVYITTTSHSHNRTKGEDHPRVGQQSRDPPVPIQRPGSAPDQEPELVFNSGGQSSGSAERPTRGHRGCTSGGRALPACCRLEGGTRIGGRSLAIRAPVTLTVGLKVLKICPGPPEDVPGRQTMGRLGFGPEPPPEIRPGEIEWGCDKRS